jgi:hypothetical protein
LDIEFVGIRIQRSKMIRANAMANKPEIIWKLNISEDGKSYQENYILLFPRYVSAIDEE